MDPITKHATHARKTWSKPATISTRHRPGHAPLPWVADLCVTLAGLGFGGVLALVVLGETHGTLAAPGGPEIALGRLTAFTGSYLMVLMVILIARVPMLERAVGQDKLVRWHRRIAPWALGLIGVHVVMVTIGYSQLTKITVLGQFWQFISRYPDMLASAVAFALLIMAGVTSIRIARNRMKYETWWVVHLYLYIALSLAIAHQIKTGVSFLGHPLTQAIWISLWIAAGALVVLFRFGQPVLRSLRHQLRVVSVHEEAPGVFAVILQGRELSKLAVSGGQFFQWRFLTKELWWHSHPYSLSALPRPPYLRVTIKGLGDQSTAAASLVPGTRVFIEGPYGAFTRHARTSERVVLIGAGVGITPLRALLEDLPKTVDVTMIVRASSAGEIAHRDELAALVNQRGGHFHEVVGSRHEVKLDISTMRRLVPNIATSDVFICGPSAFSERVVAVADRLGVRDDRIHLEAFSF